MDLKRGIDKAVAKVVENLREQAVEVGDDLKKIENVAKISANGDETIGKLIAEAMQKVSKEGDHRGGIEGYRYLCGCGGRYAVRPRLRPSLLRDRYGSDGGGL